MRRFPEIILLLGATLCCVACSNLGWDEASTVYADITIMKNGAPMQVECETIRSWPAWKSALVPAPGFVGVDTRKHVICGTTTIVCHEEESVNLYVHKRYLPIKLSFTYRGTSGKLSNNVTLTGKEPNRRFNEPKPKSEYCVYTISSYQYSIRENILPKINLFCSDVYTTAQRAEKCERMKPVAPAQQ